DGRNALRMVLESPGTGGVRTQSPIELIPGMFYHLRLRVCGEGTLSTHFNFVQASGEKSEIQRGFLKEKLSPTGSTFVRSFIAPADAAACEINFLLFQQAGFLEIQDLSLMRSDPRVPLNRIIYRTKAFPLTPTLDGDLADWPKEAFQPIGKEGRMLKDDRGESDLSARFAVARDDQHLYVAVEVEDDLDRSDGTAVQAMHMDDSVQLGFEVENRNENTERATFCIGRIDGRVTIYRNRIIPGTDIVPSYQIGPAPEGVQALVHREGTKTLYEIAIRQDAIEPRFKLDSVSKIAFCLLVNDNDGEGRKGYLEWSSGIGNSLGSTDYGTLEIAPRSTPGFPLPVNERKNSGEPEDPTAESL
ncbi:MAG: sugar-binding protein, partial [Kiritimatiellia bacterium]|nr:sugar-binding protein [Kiritimatiellia bacterium]